MRIMVLNDGVSFTNVSGCAIYEVPDGTDGDRIGRYLSRLNHRSGDNDSIALVAEFFANGAEFRGDVTVRPALEQLRVFF